MEVNNAWPPAEVLKAALILSMPYTDRNTLDRVKDIVLRNRNYFPTYYNYFTANTEKLDSYYRELNEPEGKKDWKQVTDIKDLNPGEGLMAVIKQLPIMPEEFTKEKFIEMMDAIDERERKGKELSIKKEKLFYKHFK